jgi:hypothetical protein
MSDEKQWIDPSLDGAGGGYGKFKGMTVREISQIFSRVETDADMRGLKGILRICYEQLEGRSHLAVSAQAAAVLGVVTTLLLASIPLVSGHDRDLLFKACGVSAILFAGFLSGAISTRKSAREAIAQERAIAEMAIDVLDRMVREPRFKSGSLDSLQKQTLKKMLLATKIDSTALKDLMKL